MSSWLVQAMLVPFLTVKVCGVNAKLSMLTWTTLPDVDAPLAFAGVGGVWAFVDWGCACGVVTAAAPRIPVASSAGVLVLRVASTTAR